jgi:hypothetical protein
MEVKDFLNGTWKAIKSMFFINKRLSEVEKELMTIKEKLNIMEANIKNVEEKQKPPIDEEIKIFEFEQKKKALKEDQTHTTFSYDIN